MFEGGLQIDEFERFVDGICIVVIVSQFVGRYLDRAVVVRQVRRRPHLR